MNNFGLYSEGTNIGDFILINIPIMSANNLLLSIDKPVAKRQVYPKRFIKDFSKIAGPLTRMTRKNIKFEWNEPQETAFQILKQKLCEAPILSLPEGT